jgi:hypothetical protein
MSQIPKYVPTYIKQLFKNIKILIPTKLLTPIHISAF